MTTSRIPNEVKLPGYTPARFVFHLQMGRKVRDKDQRLVVIRIPEIVGTHTPNIMWREWEAHLPEMELRAVKGYTKSQSILRSAMKRWDLFSDNHAEVFLDQQPYSHWWDFCNVVIYQAAGKAVIHLGDAEFKDMLAMAIHDAPKIKIRPVPDSSTIHPRPRWL